MTDAGGLFEHAHHATPRRGHGYCVDDVARGLVVAHREPAGADDLRAHYLAFVLAAQGGDGRFRNRRAADLRWHGPLSVDDCWGRALWGLGAAAAADPPAAADGRALAAFERGAQWRSPSPRAMAYAALGAALVLGAHPGHRGARDLLGAAATAIGRPRADPGWPWPEARLAYANAVLPEALIAAGVALEAPALVADGLALLGWLLDLQTRDGHLSVVPVGGWGPGERGPGFDQQPIEAAALADACAAAHAATGEERWRDGVALAAGWFLGDNDSATALPTADGGCCDGLRHDGRNENRGAESTLALVSTLQRARALRVDPRRPVGAAPAVGTG
jgi:hypothetical protein